jgi:nicotinamide phosphoribosyltransferase
MEDIMKAGVLGKLDVHSTPTYSGLNPLFLIDFYKVGHVSQYPSDTEQVWSNFTPRTSRTGLNKVVFFGLQYFIKEILINEWKTQFFGRPLHRILEEYRALIKATLGVENPKTDHIEALWNLHYLPLDIYAIPEGFSVDLNVPVLVMTNTDPRFFWLPNYFETILSNILWKPSTSATTAQAYRRLFIDYAKKAGETDFSFVDWQGHDFSFRGMAGREDAVLSGMGHLLSFSGTDTIPAILAAKKYYNADLTVGGSVPATEHSVMCAYGQEGEFETFRHLVEDVYPTGIVSIVSDTWDLWKVLTDYLPRMKETILQRNGKLVIRPDSGDPVKIMIGDHSLNDGSDPAYWGVLSLLRQVLGATKTKDGYDLIKNAGAIYGDSITLERADQILSGAMKENIHPYNCVFGIGSFTYEYVTRDTYGFAMKATAVKRAGKIIDIFKKPVTDNGGKNSHKGIPAVYKTIDSTGDKPEFFVAQGSKPEQLDNCAFQKVYSNGELLIDQTFAEIRERVRA